MQMSNHNPKSALVNPKGGLPTFGALALIQSLKIPLKLSWSKLAIQFYFKNKA
jgi:hypothetical protein